MLRLPCLLTVLVAVAPSTVVSIADHHFSSHGSSGSGSSGCSHASTSSSSSSSSSSPDTGGLSLPDKHVFLTHDLFAADLEGTAGADAKCNAAAAAAGLGGTYVALVSSGKQSGAGRVTSIGPWYTVSGGFAYATQGDFAGGSFTEVDDELGGTPPWRGTADVWSGSDATGAASGVDCFSWTSVASSDTATLASGATLDPSLTDAWGAGELRGSCGQKNALFCVEQ
jgi:hypothetical protein